MDNRKKKYLTWIIASVVSLVFVLGMVVGFVLINNNSKNKLPNLTQSELMAQISNQIAELDGDDLDNAIDDLQNTID